jgi:uncharacterized protein YjbI with pentapeptide repeats
MVANFIREQILGQTRCWRALTLNGAYLPDADLQNAKLNGPHLAVTSLGEVNFTNADLSDPDFTDSYLGNVKLIGTNLTNANLNGVNRRNNNENCEKRDRQL